MYKAIMGRKEGIEVWEIYKDKEYVTVFMSEWKAVQVAEEMNYKESKKKR